ncbi:MAG: glycosyltransferase family 1 protein [Steroidobacteraceae bacterium]
MRHFYFDISDIVWHAKENNRVTGIQRVQLNLLRHLAQLKVLGQVRGIFFDAKQPFVYEFDPDELFAGAEEYDSEFLLRKLGLLRNWRMFPDRFQVRKYLAPYRGRKLIRACKKIDVYVSALLSPERLAAKGLHLTDKRYADVSRIRLTTRAHLHASDVLVFMGANWSLVNVQDFASKHRRAGGDVVQFMHDLIPHLHPEFCTDRVAADFNSWLQRLSEYTNRVVCVSESTARDLFRAKRDEFVPEAVSVLRLAHEMLGFERGHIPASVAPKVAELLQQEFVLCVGTIEVRKNGGMLLRAWARLMEEMPGRLPLLVFAGKWGWCTEEMTRLLEENPQLSTVVRFIDAPSDELLASLYASCLFTVFPSLYEGWGLPIGESAWFGKYCIASSTSSMPEVCGELMDYIDPRDLESLLQTLRHAILDRKYLQERESLIRRSPLRSWQQVASNLAAILCEWTTYRTDDSDGSLEQSSVASASSKVQLSQVGAD